MLRRQLNALMTLLQTQLRAIQEALQEQTRTVHEASERARQTQEQGEPGRIAELHAIEHDRRHAAAYREKEHRQQNLLNLITLLAFVAAAVAAWGAWHYASIASGQLKTMGNTLCEIQKQTKAFSESNAINRTSAIISQRAYVSYPPSFPFALEPGNDSRTGEPGYLFVVGVENSGNTPALSIHAQINTNGPEFRRLPQNFDYRDGKPSPPIVPSMATGVNSTGVLGAHESRGAMPVGFTKATLSDVNTGKSFVYLWGRTTYKDVFGCQHQSDFCIQILHFQDDGRQQRTTSAGCEAHNCTDRDCPDFRYIPSEACRVEFNPFSEGGK
ncbi:MAG: hypothetical protein WB524_24115 [Acidobacteriaceae bacterium]